MGNESPREIAARIQHRFPQVFQEIDSTFLALARSDEERAQLMSQMQVAASEERTASCIRRVNNYLDEMHSLVWQLFPARLRNSFRPGQLPVVFVPSLLSLNAAAKVDGSGQPLILIHSGVVSNLVLMNRLVARCFDQERDRRPCIRDLCEVGCPVFVQTFVHPGFVADYLPVVERWLELFLETLKEPLGMMAGTQLHTWQEFFILCHEIAHHVLGHLHRCNKETFVSLPSLARVLLMMPGRKRELEADDWAMGLCMDVHKKLVDSGLDDEIVALSPHLLGGIDIMFQLLQYSESLIATSLKEAQTHPPAADRRIQLQRKYLGRFSESAITLMMNVESILVQLSRSQGGQMQPLLDKF